MKQIVFGLLVLVVFSCKKKNLSPKSPCVDGSCETQVWISNPSASYKDGNGYWHVKWFGPNYFTVKCKLAELKPEYVVNKVPLIECNFDSDYWIIFDTLKYTTPMYSYLGWFNDKQFNNPIAIGNYTYTLKDVSKIHPPLNMAGYQLNRNMCWDCPYTPTLFGTHSKYNYEPQQNMFLDKSMKGDTATVWIEIIYNSDIGDRDTKNIQLKIVFD